MVSHLHWNCPLNCHGLYPDLLHGRPDDGLQVSQPYLTLGSSLPLPTSLSTPGHCGEPCSTDSESLFPLVFCHSLCCLSLWILQVRCPLEYRQVYGWVLPRVWPGGQGRKAFLVPSLLLQERPGPSQLPDQEGNSKTPGESWAVVVLSV